MITNKHINIFIAVMMALVTGFSAVLLYYLADEEVVAAISPSSEPGYGKILDQYHVMEIEIHIDEEVFAEILESPIAEEYKKCDITVDGETYANVAIRTKGNTSLSQVASSDSDRYSFKVEFDHYVSGQTLAGLDKLVLNNIFCDATYVKEYMAYDIFHYLGVACPYYSFAHITVNGEEWGLYLALEAMEDSFVQRVYGTNEGELYKPESVNMDGGQPGAVPMAGEGEPQINGGMPKMGEGEMPQPGSGGPETDGEMPQMGDRAPQIDGEMPQMGDRVPQMDGEMPQMDGRVPETDGEAPKMGDGMPQINSELSGWDGMPERGRGFGESGGGSDLLYTDDETDSYQDIFDNAVFSPDNEDKERVIEALKNLSEAKELEKYIDTDACLRYFAAQTFIVNMDSYYCNLKHNYYLYEENGQLTILPWDLNLAFGGFQASDATDAVNSAIDTPMGEMLEEERPLFSKLMEVEEYKEQYHQYLSEIVNGYIGSGKFAETLDTVTSLIDSYVKTDATAFYSYEQYRTATENLKKFVLLRAESVEAQLKGTIPASDSERDNTTDYIDASTVDLKAMGIQGK